MTQTDRVTELVLEHPLEDELTDSQAKGVPLQAGGLEILGQAEERVVDKLAHVHVVAGEEQGALALFVHGLLAGPRGR